MKQILLTLKIGFLLPIMVLGNDPAYEVQNINHTPQAEVYLKFTITKKYLLFPVRENDKNVRVNVKIGGAYHDDFDISLSDSTTPEFYVFIDLGNHQDKKLEVHITNLRDEQTHSLDKINLSDNIPGFEILYRESLRPGFHFSAQRGVLGDPNGLVYHDGLYHMYFQHNPYGRYFKNTGWGHATSKDLIHWTQHNEAIRPASYKDDAWSGSAVVDHNNTSGFQSGDAPPIVAAYTSSRRGECIAYSNDGGMTFTPYENNPVLGGATAHRDPKIFWYAPGDHWVMARNYTYEKKEYIGFYSSTDLKHWTFESKEGYFHSCPEAYELPVIGMDGVTKWVIHDMFGLYKIGDFDGKRFVSDVEDRIQYNYGSAYVAGQTFSNHPENKVVLMAFSYNGVNPGMPFNNCMLFPVELRLKKTPAGIRLCPKPIEAISKLHDKGFEFRDKTASEINDLLESAGDPGDALHLQLTLDNVSEKFTLEIHGITIIIQEDSLFCKGNLEPPVKSIVRTAIDRNGFVKGPLNTKGRVELELLLDKTTLEIFGNDGALYMPVGLYFYPNFMAGLFGKPHDQTTIVPFGDPAQRGIRISSEGGNIKIKSMNLYTLKSAWE
jgi:fructan beta-fructosidase